MRKSKCMFSTAAALHRIFIAPIETSHGSIGHRAIFTTIECRPSPQPHSRFLQQPQHRTYVNDAKAEKDRLPRDHEIKDWKVSYVDENGTLHPPRKTLDILASLDLKKVTLVTVKAAEWPEYPICKIMDKQLLQQQERARRKKESGRGGPVTKTIELNWAIGGNDLRHRMERLKEFLGKGWKVEILLASKRKGKGRKATEDEGAELMKTIKETALEVGGRESKPVEGKLLQQTTMYFEGKKPQTQKKSQVNLNEVEVAEDDQKVGAAN